MPVPPENHRLEEAERVFSDGWHQYRTDAGKKYYYHEKSGSSQWAPPPGYQPLSFVDAALEVQEATVRDGAEPQPASRGVRNSTFGYIFIYLFSALFLLLVLAQFFIAILVSAWEAASDLKVEQARVHKLPPGFNWAPDTRPRRAPRRPETTLPAALRPSALSPKRFRQPSRRQ